MASNTLSTLILDELRTTVTDPAYAMADYCRKRHDKAAIAVMFYGSCLRQADQELGDALLDFYVIVDDYKTAYSSRLMACANAVLPPNIFYVELPWQNLRLRAKYAVISLQQFVRGCSPSAKNVSIWARFCQPTRLLWCRDTAVENQLVDALSEACYTMFKNAAPLVSNASSHDVLEIWTAAFKATYQAELRSESSNRGTTIIDHDVDRYRLVGTFLLPQILPLSQSRMESLKHWRARRRRSKLLNYLRLIKATFTFDGAVDYVLWKVQRHSGVVISVSDWQRRHPLLAAPVLAWKLYRLGAFR